MTTILIINAASSLLATFGIGGFLVRKHRQASRQPLVQPVFVTTETTRPRRRD
jgi:hypothetical protein